jgi:hypothetical protein
MVSQLNAGTPARESGYEGVQYIAGRITALAAGTTVNVKIGTVPAGAVITQINSRVATAITGGTPVLALGTASGGTQVQGTLAEAAGSEIVFPAASLTLPLAADTDIWAGISGGATAGDAYVVVQYIKPVA